MSKRDWLDAGLRVLAEEGVPAVTIERLTGLLGVTKGSFYHHFKGMAGFRTDLLAHFEASCTTRYIDEVEQAGGEPRERMERLLAMVLADDQPTLEPAMRAWAMQDAEARATQDRVDRQRIEYLRTLAGENLPMARLLYLVLVGAGQMPLGNAEVREVFALLVDMNNRSGGR